MISRVIQLSNPHLARNQMKYVQDSIVSGKLSSSGKYSQECESYFNQYFDPSISLLTHTCTDALEMIALLINIKEGDEIIIPSFTFVSTASAFLLRGVKIVWADSQFNHPNVDVEHIFSLITSNTKAIVVVHYAGLSVDLNRLIDYCRVRKIFIIEDAAQAFHSHYYNRKVGTIGDFATFSFHDTKPISCGEGGLLVVNNPDYVESACVVLEKGTDRRSFINGQVEQYQWKSLGSSFGASQLQAACLLAQLEDVELIFSTRQVIWEEYCKAFEQSSLLQYFRLPIQVTYSNYNTSIFYLELLNTEDRNRLIKYLNLKGIQASFHYLPLHTSPMMHGKVVTDCPYAEYWSKHLLRLPLHTSMTIKDVHYIVNEISRFYFSE